MRLLKTAGETRPKIINMLLRKKKEPILSFLFIVICFVACAQNKKELAVLAQARLLHKTVFGTKDSLTLENLFAKSLTYGHSGGKIEDRAEALHNIIHNQSKYTDTSLKVYDVMLGDDVAIVRYSFRETETKKEGQPSPLNLSIMLVWLEEKGKWKLMGRQAVKMQ